MTSDMVSHECEGEAVYAIDVVDGKADAHPCYASWDMRDASATSMALQATDSRADYHERRLGVSADAVFHPRINVDKSQPHKGRSPAEIGGYTSSMAANLEQALSYETGGSTGSVLPHPESLAGPNLEALRSDLAALRGRTALVATMNKNFGEGRAGAPADWQPRRIGANPPDSIIALRGDAVKSMLAVCGVPPSIFDGGSNANAAREGLRQYLHSTLSPLAELVALEARG